MSGPDGVGGSKSADRAGGDRAGGVGAADRAGARDGGISAKDADRIAADAVDAPDDAAALEAERVAGDRPADTFEPAAEAPGVLSAAGSWVADTAVGYAQGAVNGVLGAANLVNSGVNAGLGAAGIDYRFETDMRIDPANDTQRHAQDAIAVAELAAGAYGLVRSAPRIAGALEDVGSWARSRVGGRPAPVNATFNGTPVGELLEPNPSRHRLQNITERSVAKRVTTVAEPGVDMGADVAAIRRGEGQIVGERITVNGRTYGSHDGTLYPVEGDGLHQLDRGTFKALQTIRKHGVEGARPYLDNMGVSAETRARAAALLELLP